MTQGDDRRPARGGDSLPLQKLHMHTLSNQELLEVDSRMRQNPRSEEYSVEEMEKKIFLTTLDKVTAWGQSNSVWPAVFGLACCAMEMMSFAGARYDVARFGSEVFRATPRQADLMIVAGRVSQKMAEPLRQIYDQMLEPKWVMAMGACSSSGGMFSNYAVVQGVHKIVPVDVHVPGCPPRPEQLLHGINTLQDKIRKGIPAAYLQEVGVRTHDQIKAQHAEASS